MSKNKISTWSDFYYVLHVEAERIRKLMKSITAERTATTPKKKVNDERKK